MIWVLFYIAAGAALAVVAPGGWLDLALAIPGYAVTEYAIHRFLLHGPWNASVAYKVHGAHHAAPTDRRHIHVPPALVGAALLAVALAVRGVTGEIHARLLGLMLLQFGVFELLHLGLHGHGGLAGRLPRFLMSHHAAHHARDSGAAFAVTWPIADRIFRTRQGPLFRCDAGGMIPTVRIAARSPEDAARKTALWPEPNPSTREVRVVIDGTPYVVRISRSSVAGSSKRCE